MKARRRSVRGLGSAPEVHEKNMDLFLALSERFLRDAGNKHSPNRCANSFEALHFASKADAENSHVSMDKTRAQAITQAEKRARVAVSLHCVCSENRIRKR